MTRAQSVSALQLVYQQMILTHLPSEVSKNTDKLNNTLYIHCTQIIDIIRVLQTTNIIYEIHETCYKDIK